MERNSFWNQSHSQSAMSLALHFLAPWDSGLVKSLTCSGPVVDSNWRHIDKADIKRFCQSVSICGFEVSKRRGRGFRLCAMLNAVEGDVKEGPPSEAGPTGRPSSTPEPSRKTPSPSLPDKSGFQALSTVTAPPKFSFASKMPQGPVER